MTVEIVVALEVVDVAEDERERLAVTRRTRDLGREVIVEPPSVREASEGVRGRELLELFRELDALGDVDRESADPDRLAVGSGDHETHAGKMTRSADRRNRVRHRLDALLLEHAAVARDEALRELRREDLGVGLPDGDLRVDAEPREAVRAAVQVS